jgi:hypothetical protein
MSGLLFYIHFQFIKPDMITFLSASTQALTFKSLFTLYTRQLVSQLCL